MNIKIIKDGIARSFGRNTLIVRKYSPEILLGVGIIGGVVSAIMAAKATLKMNELSISIEEERAEIELAEEEGKTESGKSYSKEDYTRDLGIHYVQTILKFAKLYGPSVGVGALSIVSILASHGIMTNRQIALIAAYNLINEGFKSYRERVVEELGEQVDKDYFLGLRDEEHTETITDSEGKKTKIKKVTKTRNLTSKSIYSRFFDESNSQYQKDRLLNKAFLQAQQNYMNDVLNIRGHIFLNEVYEALGFPHTKEGAIVGWVLKSTKEMKKDSRDGYVDFGLYDVENDPGREFINLTNPTILLDFNVDGIIFDLI